MKDENFMADTKQTVGGGLSKVKGYASQVKDYAGQVANQGEQFLEEHTVLW